MTPSRWARIKSIFLRARDMSRPGDLLEDASETTAGEVQRLLNAAEAGSPTGIRLPDSSGLGGSTHSTKALFDAGARVAGRFDILRLLGRGGMGEVYEALDTVKGQLVALKLLHLNPAIDAQNAERLLRKEVTLAQRVSHRNICRIYDPYRHEFPGGHAILLLSMELLRGRTLAELCAERERLPPDEALPIARQIADGIDAAHAAGIIHRDLKPSNVMVVDEPGGMRVVITDFGLARSLPEGQSAPTVSQGVAGTLRYMAPEQLQGRADERSDLYTFCLLLFELVTGQQPFSGATDVSLALSRLSTPPSDPAEFVPNLSLAWRKTLLRGLDRDPARRFSNAGEIIASLESRAYPWVALPQIVLTKLRRSRPWLKWALVPMFLVIAGIVAYLRQPAPTPISPFSKLLVADLEHAPSADHAILGASAILSSAIGQSPYLTVTRPADLAETFRRMGKPFDRPLDAPALRELAIRTEQGAILRGNIVKGREYTLHLTLEEPGPDPRYEGHAVSGDFAARDEKQLFDAIASTAQWVRQLSGEGRQARNEQNVRPEDLTTGSWKALSLLQQARDRRDADDPQSALIFAGEALELDPGFAAAESLRGDVLVQLGSYKQGFAAHSNAVEMAKRRNITGRERYRIESVYDYDIGEQSALVDTCKAWIAHFPHDITPHFYLAENAYLEGDFTSAIGQMQSGQKIDPGSYVTYPHLAAYRLGLGQVEPARECAAKLRQLGETGWATEVEGQILLVQHRFAEALEKIRPLLKRDDDVLSEVAPRYVANTLADTGRLSEAEGVLAEAAAADYQRGLLARRAERAVSIAYLRSLRHDRRGVQSAIIPYISALDTPDALSLAGALLARSGDSGRAQRILSLLAQWPDVPVANSARARLRAEIALAKSSPTAAAAIDGVDSHADSPVILDFRFHAARALHREAEFRRVRRQIIYAWDTLLKWEYHPAVPGLYWSALCQQPDGSLVGDSAPDCRVH